MSIGPFGRWDEAKRAICHSFVHQLAGPCIMRAPDEGRTGYSGHSLDEHILSQLSVLWVEAVPP